MPHHIPTTLQASLTSRLDRLGPAKEVAQIGAVIGRRFSYALLAAVADRDEPELRALLDQLVAAGLVFQEAAWPHAAFRFKHALVQGVAYESLLRSARQQPARAHRRDPRSGVPGDRARAAGPALGAGRQMPSAR